MVARALGDLAEEGNLPKALFTQAAPQPDFRFGVQLSTPVQSELKHVEHGQVVSGDTPKPQPMESVGHFQHRQSVERETSNHFSQYLGTSSAAPMSKEDTIRELANKINHDSGNKMSIEESRAEATKQYEKEEAKVAGKMASSAPKGTTIYGTDPTDIAKNLGSSRRMRGETGEQYSNRRHRMDDIKRISDPTQRKEALGKFVSEQLGDNYLPVLIRRADGQHATLAHFLSGVNISNDDSATVKGSNGETKDPGSYYSVLPPFFGFSTDQSGIYTGWFGKSQGGLMETSSIYQFTVNGDNDEQIKLNVTPSANGDPPQISVYDGSNTGKYGPYELYLDNANTGSTVTLSTDADDIPQLILYDGSNTGKYGPYELYLENTNKANITLTTDDDPELYIEKDGKSVTLDIPTSTGSTKVDAVWQEIDICVDGEAKKMKVLGTEPY
jgi:hypothetical protein